MADDNNNNEGEDVMVVNPWVVKGKVDYNKLIDHFGSSKIDEAVLQRFEKLTGKPPHHFFT